ncbi:MAG: hypothetical protein AB1430_09045 [Pseudomonadota bacterium]
MQQLHRGMALMLVFAALWAGEEALLGRLQGKVHVVQVVWMRFAIHLAVVWTLLAWRGQSLRWRPAALRRQALRAVALAAMPACWLLGLRSGADAVSMLTVFWLAPLLILLVGPRLFGPAARLPAIGATAVGALGAWWLLGRDFPHAGEILPPLGMALAFSAYVLLTVALRGESALANLFWLGLGVCVLLAPVLPVVWVMPGLRDLLVIAAVALVGLLGLWALERAVAAGPLWPALPMVFMQLPCAMLLALPHALHHPVDVTLGSLVIAVAAVAAWRLEARRSAAVAPLRPQGAAAP